VSNVLRHWLAQPYLLALLALLPLLGLLALWSRRRRRQTLELLGRGPAFDEALRKRTGWRRTRFLLLWVGLSLLALGAAGPQWGRDWGETTAKGRDLVVVLDLSGSMLAESKSRLERAKLALLDLCGRVETEGGHRLGLVVFAGHAKLACPLTHDYAHFREVVSSFRQDRLDPTLWAEDNAASGTRIGEAVALAVEAHDTDAGGVRDLLLVSDGDDPARDEEWRVGIAVARASDIPVHTAGVGDPEKTSPIPLGEGGELFHDGDRVMTKLEEKPLREIARETGGVYVRLGTSEYPLGMLYLQRMATSEEREQGVDALPLYRQRYAWFLTPAFVLLGVTMLLGETRRK
jgi:Ca-activated chloride channel family protein